MGSEHRDGERNAATRDENERRSGAAKDCIVQVCKQHECETVCVGANGRLGGPLVGKTMVRRRGSESRGLQSKLPSAGAAGGDSEPPTESTSCDALGSM